MPLLGAIGDPTDLQGTLHPDLPPEPTTGTKFKLLYCPKFDHKINLPPGLQSDNIFGI